MRGLEWLGSYWGGREGGVAQVGEEWLGCSASGLRIGFYRFRVARLLGTLFKILFPCFIRTLSGDPIIVLSGFRCSFRGVELLGSCVQNGQAVCISTSLPLF